MWNIPGMNLVSLTRPLPSPALDPLPSPALDVLGDAIHPVLGEGVVWSTRIHPVLGKGVVWSTRLVTRYELLMLKCKLQFWRLWGLHMMFHNKARQNWQTWFYCFSSAPAYPTSLNQLSLCWLSRDMPHCNFNYVWLLSSMWIVTIDRPPLPTSRLERNYTIQVCLV